MTPTRQRILAYLQEHRKASAPELSQALAMTRANMRYHLDRLLEEGAIEAEPVSADTKGRGRPVRIYRLSTGARPNNLAQLASLLIDQLLALYSEEQRPQMLQALANSLAAQETLSKNLTQRLTKAVQILNGRHYQSRWEARPQGPEVSFRNCPYAAILPDHPELCQMDAALLEHLLGEPVLQMVRMDIYSSRPPACVFALAKRPS